MRGYIDSRCQEQGCRLHIANAAIEQARQLVTQIKDSQRMSRALWCDQGDHAFSERDAERRHFAETEIVDGEESTTAYDVCGPCSAPLKLRRKALPVVKDVVPDGD